MAVTEEKERGTAIQIMTRHDLLQKDLNDINLVHCHDTRATCYVPQGMVTLAS